MSQALPQVTYEKPAEEKSQWLRKQTKNKTHFETKYSCRSNKAVKSMLCYSQQFT